MTLTRADVGRRVVVRRVLPGEQGPSGGPALTDVIGVLQEYGGEHLLLRREDGSTVRIALTDVVAAKTVPPPARRRR